MLWRRAWFSPAQYSFGGNRAGSAEYPRLRVWKQQTQTFWQIEAMANRI
jgi:hypothetical protein